MTLLLWAVILLGLPTNAGIAQTAERRLEEPKAAGSTPAPGTITSPPAVSSDATVRGSATWYRYFQGQAAAGPALRKALGSDWRGQTVRVCGLSTCIRTTLTDFCACGPRHGVPTVIDLDVHDFDALGDPSAGVMRVSVSLGSDRAPSSTLPPTDTLP